MGKINKLKEKLKEKIYENIIDMYEEKYFYNNIKKFKLIFLLLFDY
jgi:hypothetical protein